MGEDPDPVDEEDRTDYFDSIFHSAAVVGINTSAMIESAIQGKPVLSVTPQDFSDTQGGTLHFGHLVSENGGFLRIARNLDVHVSQLADVLAGPEAVRAEIDRFVSSFVRPQGLDRPSTPRLADGIDELAEVVPADDRRGQLVSQLARTVLNVWLAVDSATGRRYQARWVRRRGRRLRRRFARAVKSARQPSRAARHSAKALRHSGFFGSLLAWLVRAAIRPLDVAGHLAALVLGTAGHRIDRLATALSERIATSPPNASQSGPRDPEAPEADEDAASEADPPRPTPTEVR